VYSGPSRVGPELWSYSAELEVRDRIALAPGWGDFPEFILDSSIFDIAVNRELPLNEWQIYIEAMDTAVNQDWPNP